MLVGPFAQQTIILPKQQSCDAKCMNRISAHSLLVAIGVSSVDALAKIDLTEQEQELSD